MTTVIRDAHTHLFSRNFFTTLAEQAPGEGSVDDKLAACAAAAGIELPGSLSELVVRWLLAMDSTGVESIVTFASVPQEAEAVAEACRLAHGRMSGYVVLDPRAPTAAGLVDRAFGELGLRGVVLFPVLHGYDVGDDAVAPILERVGKAQGVCVVHTGVLRIALRERLGLPRTYDPRFADPLLVVRAAQRVPQMPFVLPHFGGGFLRETLLAASWCDNIHVDTSSSNSWMATHPTRLTLADVFKRAYAVLGPRRILFGTDSSVWPRGYRADLLTSQLEALDAAGIPTEDQALILGGNLERLLAR